MNVGIRLFGLGIAACMVAMAGGCGTSTLSDEPKGSAACHGKCDDGAVPTTLRCWLEPGTIAGSVPSDTLLCDFAPELTSLYAFADVTVSARNVVGGSRNATFKTAGVQEVNDFLANEYPVTLTVNLSLQSTARGIASASAAPGASGAILLVAKFTLNSAADATVAQPLVASLPLNFWSVTVTSEPGEDVDLAVNDYKVDVTPFKQPFAGFTSTFAPKGIHQVIPGGETVTLVFATASGVEALDGTLSVPGTQPAASYPITLEAGGQYIAGADGLVRAGATADGGEDGGGANDGSIISETTRDPDASVPEAAN